MLKNFNPLSPGQLPFPSPHPSTRLKKETYKTKGKKFATILLLGPDGGQGYAYESKEAQSMLQGIRHFWYHDGTEVYGEKEYDLILNEGK